MDENTDKPNRKARATVYIADDSAYDEILGFLRERSFIAYTHTASSPAKRLVVKEEGF